MPEAAKKLKRKSEARIRLLSQPPLDWPLAIIVLTLVVFGLVMLFSASYATAYYRFKGDSFHFIRQQALFAAVGVVVMFVASHVDYHIFHKFAWPIMAVTVVLLIVVLFMPELNGAKRWIFLPIGGNLQPSEVAKFAVIVLFAHIISINHKRMKTFAYGVLPFVVILGVIAGLMLLEPHLSGTVLILGIGGLLMYGIPNMKLEKQIIDRKIDCLKKTGIEFVTGTEIANGKNNQNPAVAKGDEMAGYLTDAKVKNIKAEKLLEEYDAVILACGASNPRDIKVTGRDAKGIYFAVDFLKTTTRSLLNSNFADGKYVSAKGKKVLVIGGGDTGNDCVGTSIRQGAVAVTQLEMMPKLPETRAANNPWPEWPRVLKTDYGQQEAIAKFGHDPRIYETTVKEIVKNKDGQVCAAKCVKLAWEKDPETGRMNMKEIPDSEYTIECDLILIAAGFLGTQKYVADAFGVKLNARTNVETAPGEHKTNVDKVYTCGDMHRGQSLVVWAIREGRDAAKEVDTFLNGYSNDF